MEVLRFSISFVYQFGMFFGLIMLASHWASDSIKNLSFPLPLFLGLAIPFVAWALGFFNPLFALGVPVSLGALYWLSERELSHGEAVSKTVTQEDLRHANRMIAEDPKNAAAYWAKAKALEAQGEHQWALEEYQKAHGLSKRTISDSEMDDIRARLEHAIKAGDSHGLRDLWAPVERFFLAAGLIILFWHWLFGVTLTSLMLYLLWVRRRAV